MVWYLDKKRAALDIYFFWFGNRYKNLTKLLSLTVIQYWHLQHGVAEPYLSKWDVVKVRCYTSAIIFHVTWKKMDFRKVNGFLWVTSAERHHAFSERAGFNYGIDPKERVVLTRLAYRSSTLHYKLFSGNKLQRIISKHWLLLANEGDVRIWRLWHFMEQPSNQPRKKTVTHWSRYIFCSLTINTHRGSFCRQLVEYHLYVI